MRTILILAAFAEIFLPARGYAASSEEQKSAVVALCARVISDYSKFLATGVKPKNIVALEREYANCAVVIDEYVNRL